MKERKLRVLMDLSLALRGFSGIPQDTRLLFKTLASSPEVEVTGFIYPSWARNFRHKFAKPDAPRGERLANQACLLWGLEEVPQPAPFRVLRVLKRIHKLAATLTARTAQFDTLDSDAFWQVMWRLIFQQTLSAADLPLVRNGRFKLMNVAAETMHRRMVWNRRPLAIDTRGYDFLIVQTARAVRVSQGTSLIVRYHDMIPITQPDTTLHTQDIRWHHNSICQTLDSTYVCNSEPTRANLVQVYPQLAERSATVPYMVSSTYWPEANTAMLTSILDSRRSAATGVQSRRPLEATPRYIMAVSTLEPRKNYAGLIQAFNAARFRESVKRTLPNLKLLVVGTPGWRYQPILDQMKDFVARGDVIHLEHVTSDELRVLYTHAEAFVFPSHAEGFGFPPLEAMQCDVPVIASDLPEHRWVLGDAALFCGSYDTVGMADAIEQLVASPDSASLRAKLIARGRERVKRYALENCSRQWLDLLHGLMDGSFAAGASAEAVRAQQAKTQRSLMDQAA
jgi:glycosyltransferase involved in cell wall biosynthesis